MVLNQEEIPEAENKHPKDDLAVDPQGIDDTKEDESLDSPVEDIVKEEPDNKITEDELLNSPVPIDKQLEDSENYNGVEPLEDNSLTIEEATVRSPKMPNLNQSQMTLEMTPVAM